MAKVKKYSPEQIVNILRQIEVALANGKSHPIASREAGITEQTYYRWRKDALSLDVLALSREALGFTNMW